MPKGEYLQYGGQAVPGGVMMRSPKFFSVACRAPSGEIVIQTEEIEKTWIGRQKWLRTPFLRGSLALLDAMALGMRAMRFAARIQLADADGAEPETQSKSRIQDGAIGATMVLSLVLGLGLFVFLPNLLAEFIERERHVTDSTQINIVAGAIKLVLFFGYLWGIGQLPDIREVFRYHGAEHKAINTLEHERPLVIDECLNQSRLHPRCGTSFAVIVLLLGLIIFTFVPRYPVTHHQGAPLVDVSVRFLIELLILPFIAGISYELLRLAGKFRNQAIVDAVFKPGIWSQFLTTKEPESGHVEVALAALQAVLDAEQGNRPVSPTPSS